MKIEKRRKIKKIIIFITIILILSLIICLSYLFFYKNTKFYLNESLVELKVNNTYNLKEYIKLSNLKIEDLTITSSNNMIARIEKDKIITSDRVGKAIITVKYKDLIKDFILNVTGDILKCNYDFEDIAVYLLEDGNKKGFSLNTDCDNLSVTYNDDIKINFDFKYTLLDNHNKDIFGSIQINDYLVSNQKINVTAKDGIVYILKTDNLYIIDIIGTMEQCGYSGNIIIINKYGHVITDTKNYYLTLEEIDSLNLIRGFSYIRKMSYDIKRKTVIEKITNCPYNIIDCNNKNILDKNINITNAYSEKNGYLNLLFTKTDTIKEYCEKKEKKNE